MSAASFEFFGYGAKCRFPDGKTFDFDSYFDQLIVVNFLRDRFRSRFSLGLLFTADFFYLVSLTYAEWLGLFGYPYGCFMPGFRLSLASRFKDVALTDKVFFCKVSEGFFRKILDRDVTFTEKNLDDFSFFGGLLFSDVSFSKAFLKGVEIWKCFHPVSGSAYFRFCAETKSFEMLYDFIDDLKWSPFVPCGDQFLYFLFPERFRDFWVNGKEFFGKFSFSCGFNENLFIVKE